MVLIITHKVDLCADLVIPRLQARGEEVARVNIEDYPLEISLSYYPGLDAIPKLVVYGKAFDLSVVTAVWYRVPYEYSARRWAVDYQMTRFIEASCNHLWSPLELFLKCFWLDRPLAVRKASYKLHQLAVAADLGLCIPKTCVTNDPEAVKHFRNSLADEMVVKTICGGALHTDEGVYAVYTNPVSDSDMEKIDTVNQCPCQFQEYVPKEVELRVIVVGSQVFAIEIHSQQSEKTKHDWRHYDFAKVAHRVHALPNSVRDQCLALVHALDLRFGAIDMIVTPSGEYVFLEINPTGQYQWLESMTGLPITDSIVELLINAPPE